jgi:hypothetical protein
MLNPTPLPLRLVVKNGTKMLQYQAQSVLSAANVEQRTFTVAKSQQQIREPSIEQVSLPLVLHFGTNGNSEVVGFIDSPNQHVNGIPVTEATSVAGKVVLKAGALNAEYHADLSGNTLVGQWTQGPLTVPLTLKKK